MMKKITYLVAFLTVTMTFGQNLATGGDLSGVTDGNMSTTKTDNAFYTTIHGASSTVRAYVASEIAEINNSTDTYGRIDYQLDESVLDPNKTYRVSFDASQSVSNAVPLICSVRIGTTAQALSLTNFSSNLTYNAGGPTYNAAALTTSLVEYYYGWSPADNTSTHTIRFQKNKESGGVTGDVFVDNLELKVLDAATENIEMLSAGGSTSLVSIYENDIDDGSAVTNTSLVSSSFSTGGFTLNADGTIANTGGNGIGDYSITYTITSGNGTDAITQTFKVVAVLATEDLTQFNFSYYPNPTKDRLNLSAVENIDRVELVNLLGQSVLRKNLNARNATLDISHLTEGVYIMKLSINGAVGTYKIIKE